MSGKKKTPAWKTLLWGLGFTAALYGAGVLLTAWLTLRGVVPEEQITSALAAAAFLGCLGGGAAAGGGALGPGGSMVNAAVFCAVLVLVAFGVWDGVTARGLVLLLMAAAGGLAGCLIRGRRSGRRSARLVKTNKSRRIS